MVLDLDPGLQHASSCRLCIRGLDFGTGSVPFGSKWKHQEDSECHRTLCRGPLM